MDGILGHIKLTYSYVIPIWEPVLGKLSLVLVAQNYFSINNHNTLIFRYFNLFCINRQEI